MRKRPKFSGQLKGNVRDMTTKELDIESMILRDGTKIGELDLAGYEEEELGFLPYWAPGVVCKECGEKVPKEAMGCEKHKDAGITGNALYAIPMFVEERASSDGEVWDQFVLQAACEMPGLGRRGPKEDAEIVDIVAGDMFVLTAGKGLPLQRFFGVPVHIRPVGKRKPKNPRHSPMIEYQALVSQEVKALLKTRKEAAARELMAARFGIGKKVTATEVPELKNGDGAAKQLAART